ncbi:hypothetical protein [Streptomyces sp. NPDC059215]|uniref:hypothetical protein n=1 Tax=Streptomyces sp. NPDC059215 TaxID=3346772 RepID=UPI00369242FE
MPQAPVAAPPPTYEYAAPEPDPPTCLAHRSIRAARSPDAQRVPPGTAHQSDPTTGVAMTDTLTTTALSTPEAVARAVLDAIQGCPDAFGMHAWCWLPDGAPLPPNVALPSGATLCAAAWAAHLTGWTLVSGTTLVKVTSRLNSDTLYEGYAYDYALKSGERCDIASVADDALGLESGHGLWTGEADAALARLREIAGR